MDIAVTHISNHTTLKKKKKKMSFKIKLAS